MLDSRSVCIKAIHHLPNFFVFAIDTETGLKFDDEQSFEVYLLSAYEFFPKGVVLHESIFVGARYLCLLFIYLFGKGAVEILQMKKG
jgi:hypothetical protein